MPIKVLLLLISLIFLTGCTTQEPKAPHKAQTEQATPQSVSIEIKASFLIFTNGTKREFTDKKYHHLNEYVYIDGGKPTTIVVKKENTKWEDFFKTLPMQLTDNCLTTGTGQKFCNNNTATLKFYINGIRSDEALSTTILNGDELLVSYGSEKDGDNKLVRQILQIPEP